MRFRSSLLAACTATLLLSGCGTITNLRNAQKPPGEPPRCRAFGGVREDVGTLTEAAEPRAVLVLFDLPLSLVGDTLTLPWAVKAARRQKARPAEPAVCQPEP